ncbi:penicillin acylase family protein [Algoriphagus marinus]|uniref:penicillin acylase family protein n=1 Tax=Algoriphagus marinus TaxID=1925762 RepID=UPI00094B97CF|nr:penicillin acylase family protein [Algoriphagus marinus]
MKKIGIIIGSLILLILVGLLAFIYLHSPQYKGELNLEGLNSEVEVLFDEFGVPHIYAENEEDAYQALGYVHAQDRLFQLEMMRRVGTGSLAELLGPDLVEIDKFFRTLGIPNHAKESTTDWNNQPNSPWKSATEAYIKGVNQFIQEGKLPVEYTLLGATPREFTVNDVHGIMGYMSFTFAMGVKTDPLISKMARELAPEYLEVLSLQTLPNHYFIPNHYPDSLANEVSVENSLISMLGKLPVPALEGSNSWVIAGSKTKSGKVLFLNDTHIGFSSPSVWYEAHIEYPGYSYYGNHLAGMPFGLVGHSKNHSIGLTMFENDDQDFFEIKTNPSNSNSYLIGDVSYPFQSRTETIKVKGEADQTLEIRSTIHGPILNDVVPEISALTSNPVASWWVYTLQPTQALEATYKFNHAESMQEVADAASLIHAPGLNIMYGDSSGNIAWWAAAKLPIRSEKIHSKIFADGSDNETLPKGWYPFTDNPQSVNPSNGYVISANNQPDTMKNGVLFPGYYYPGDRYQRIATTLETRNDWDMESIKSLQLETVNTKHPKNAKQLIQAVNPAEFENYQEILERLGNWDGDHNLKDIEPTLYYKWLYHTLRLSMEDELGESAFSTYLETFLMIRSTENFLTSEQNPWWDNTETPEIESKSMIVSLALAQSLEELNTQLGSNWKDWNWEKAIISEHPHPLGSQKPLDKIFNVKTEPLKANAEGINKLAFKLNGGGIYKVTSGPAMRIILDFEDVEKSISVLPTGQSGNRFSKHYRDQAKMYVKGRYRSQLMNRNDILNNSGDPLILKPLETSKAN